MSSQYSGVNLFPIDYAIPADSDDRDAAAVNVALEALGDRTVFLYANQAGAYRVVAEGGVMVGTPESAGGYMICDENDVWVQLTDESDPMAVAFSDLKAGDVIAISFSCGGFLNSKNTSVGKIRARMTIGSAESTMVGFGPVAIKRETTVAAESYDFSLASTGRYVVTEDVVAVEIDIQGLVISADPDAVLHIQSPISFTAQVLRANPLAAGGPS